MTSNHFRNMECGKSGGSRSRLLILLFTSAWLPLLSPAQVNYAVDGGTAYVTNSPNASGNVVIASTYSGYPVIAIAYAAFDSCTNLTSVSIPDSVTNIAGWVFTGCSSLTNIAVSAANPTYSSVQGVLFDQAQTTLKAFPPGRGGSYVIPTTVTDIGTSSFFACASLTSVTIPHGVTRIHWLAFASCVNLTSVTIPDSVFLLGGQAFSGCHSLTQAVIGTGVTGIDFETFGKCTSLTNVPLGNGIVSIGENAFYFCTSLTNATIPDSVTGLGSSAFAYCTNLTSVTVGNGVTRIGGAFTGCTGLGTVTIGSGVFDDLQFEFYDAPELTNITVVASNSSYSSINGVLFDKSQTSLLKFPRGIGGSYLIPASVTIIGYNAFYFCAGLTSVTIPNGVNTIGAYAFNHCSSLTNITVAVANPNYSSTNGVLFNKSQTILLRCPEGFGGSYVVPGTVLYIWDAFANCSRLSSVVIPNSVVSIGASAFNSCVALTNATIGNSVANIQQSAFNACGSLTSLIIPASVTNIGSSAFSACANLTNLTFRGDRPMLGSAAFSGVAAGAKVYYYYGTLGWGPTYGGLPTVMLQPQPQIGSDSAGLKPGGFGFPIAGIPDQIIVVEASTNLTNWHPIWTNILSGAVTDFTDMQWTNFPNRFYRAGGSISLLLITNLFGVPGSQTNFLITVPAGKTSLQISTTGGTGDCDLYVRFGIPPTLSTWDYRPYLDGNNESVTISNPTAGNWHIMVHGFTNYSGVTMRVK